MHWTAKWLGRPWVAGSYQCEDFVAEVLREEFGLDVPKGLRGAEERSWDRQLSEHAARCWALTVSPADGDGALMISTAAAGRRFYHVGVYVAARPALVLHCPRGGASVLQLVGELGAHALRLEGVYRWNG